jgi:site-specific recombinase XerD
MKACSQAGIQDFHFHDLRHTFASHLVMNGVDLTTVKELLGHKSMEMTMRYAHLSQQHRKAAVEGLGQTLDGHFMDTLDNKAVCASFGEVSK